MSQGRGRAKGASYQVEIPPEVAAAVRSLPPDIKRQIKQTLRRLAGTPEAGKLLTGELAGLRSYPARRFRIVYQLIEAQRRLLVLHIAHRRTVYEELTRKLKGQDAPP
jgi:mRNA interferase RelE/StbE